MREEIEFEKEFFVEIKANGDLNNNENGARRMFVLCQEGNKLRNISYLFYQEKENPYGRI